MTREYDKLVRDRIPEIIEADGETPITHRADDTEYAGRLAEKLVEEATGYREDREPAELADLLAVVHAICDQQGISRDRLTELRREKAAERGGFEERIVLEAVEP